MWIASCTYGSITLIMDLVSKMLAVYNLSLGLPRQSGSDSAEGYQMTRHTIDDHHCAPL